MRAYYMQNPTPDQREPCELDPPREASISDLESVGVWYKKIPISDGWEEALDREAAEVGLKYRDEVFVNRQRLPNYDDKIKMFFEEHLHLDPEVRFVKEGSGYFDVRDVEDKWIRVAVSAGDLLFLPAGIYHRFTVDTNDFVHAIRLFKDEPKWEAFNRSNGADTMPIRDEFLHSIQAQ